MSIERELRTFTLWLLAVIAVATCVCALVALTPFARDDSDPGGWGARSGLRPATDSLTGCEYLLSPRGGITPRFDTDGQHIGCRDARSRR